MIEFTIPLALPSEANISEHWTVRSKRRNSQNFALKLYLNKYEKPGLPCTITLIRIGPKPLDSDNNISAFKSIRDFIADWVNPGKAKGQADNDPRIIWQYGQETAKLHGIRIRIV